MGKYRQLAFDAWNNGFKTVIPLHPGQKRPSINGWQTTPPEGRTTTELNAWWHGDDGVGFVMTGQLVALDCDILDVALAQHLADQAERIVGRTPLVRIGRAPKWVRLYRSPYEMPTRRYAGLEIYCRGGQVAMFGVHPDTGLEYQWPLQSPASVNITKVPYASEAALLGFVDTVYDLLPQVAPVAREPGRAVSNSVTGEVRAVVRAAMSDPMATEQTALEMMRTAHPGSRHYIVVELIRMYHQAGLDMGGLRGAFIDAAGPSRAPEFDAARIWVERRFAQIDNSFDASIEI